MDDLIVQVTAGLHAAGLEVQGVQTETDTFQGRTRSTLWIGVRGAVVGSVMVELAAAVHITDDRPGSADRVVQAFVRAAQALSSI